MTNIFKMMKDAVSAQKNLKKIQEELKGQVVEYSAAGGKINVKAGGDASIIAIKIDPSLIAPAKGNELESQLVRAVNGALDEAKKKSAECMQELMGKMGLPNIPGL